MSRRTTERDVLALAEAMAADPASAAMMADQLAAAVIGLAPPDSRIVTRTRLDRCARYTHAAVFRQVGPQSESPVYVIELPPLPGCRGWWVRGVSAQVYRGAWGLDPEAAIAMTTQLNWLSRPMLGYNAGWWAEANWTVNGLQGFQTDGPSETYVPLNMIAGDGCHPAPLGWELFLPNGATPTISVRVRNRMLDVLDPAVFGEVPPAEILRMLTLSYVVVAFETEPIPGEPGD